MSRLQSTAKCRKFSRLFYLFKVQTEVFGASQETESIIQQRQLPNMGFYRVPKTDTFLRPLWENCRTCTMYTDKLLEDAFLKKVVWALCKECDMSLPCGNRHERLSSSDWTLETCSNLLQPRSVIWCNGTGFQLRCLHDVEATAKSPLQKARTNCPCLDAKLCGHMSAVLN